VISIPADSTLIALADSVHCAPILRLLEDRLPDDVTAERKAYVLMAGCCEIINTHGEREPVKWHSPQYFLIPGS
jgi:hypothetical protein